MYADDFARTGTLHLSCPLTCCRDPCAVTSRALPAAVPLAAATAAESHCSLLR